MEITLAKLCYRCKQYFASGTLYIGLMPKVDINHILATNLKIAIERKFGKVNQSALSRESGVPQTKVSYLLNPERREPTKTGKAPSPTLTTLVDIAAALNVEPWELLHPDPDKVRREHEFYRRIETDFKKLPQINGVKENEAPDKVLLDQDERRKSERRANPIGRNVDFEVEPEEKGKSRKRE